MNIEKKPELVSPAGDWTCLKTAVESGADSVYFGIKGINMRDKASNFDILEINKIMDYLHKLNIKGYLTLNTIILNKDIAKVKKILEQAKIAKVDAVILWDMAVFSMAKDMGLRIHISTQASVSNIESMKFYASLGAKRIVLARECSMQDLKEIKKIIKKEDIKCQIETFIHGAMCISISGRCFMSQDSFSESANIGRCLQPCRREYLIKDIQENTEYILNKDYILSPKDLCTIDFIDSLIKLKIDSFKIEGRMRSPEYIKVVTSVYRQAIDRYFTKGLSNKDKEVFKKELKNVYNRGFSDGFYFGHPKNWKSKKLEHEYKKEYLGIVKKFYKKIGVAEIHIENKSLKLGQEILFMSKNTPVKFVKVKEMQKEYINIDSALRGEKVGIKLPFKVRSKDKVFLWIKQK